MAAKKHAVQAPTFDKVIYKAEKYISYLMAQHWFNKKTEKTKESWIKPLSNLLEAARAKKAMETWECIIDHIQETHYKMDNLPNRLSSLYESVEELRTHHGVDSTNPQCQGA